jgi:signal peptidase I
LGTDAPARGGDSESTTSFAHRASLVVRDIVVIVLVALAISFLVKTFIARPFFIPSDSMDKTLQPGDRVLVSLLTPGVTPLKRGDVVVFEDPGGWLRTTARVSGAPDVLAFLGLAAPDDNSHLVKRVIGLPGDTVSCCTPSGQVAVNGTPLAEPYVLLPPGKTAADKYTYSVTVPKGSLWVLGDNRYDSADSAYRNDKHMGTAFVPVSDVVGRALVISWPLSRWTYLNDYPDTFANIGHAQPAIVPQG